MAGKFALEQRNKRLTQDYGIGVEARKSVISTNVILPYLISIKTFKIVATQVRRIPVSSMLGDERPEKTPGYNSPKKDRAVHNVGTDKSTSNISWTEVKIKPVSSKKSILWFQPVYCNLPKTKNHVLEDEI